MSFVVNLEYKPYMPLYRRLSDGLRRAILEGRLKNGEALPSIRDLSDTLKVSRATVLRALDDLQNQELVNSIPGKGLFVSYEGQIKPTDDVQRTRVERAFAPKLSSYARRVLELCKTETTVHLPEINYGGPPLDLTPLNEWRRLLSRYCRASDIANLSSEIEPFGYPPLREAASAYLHRARAVNCRAGQLAVFSTKQLRLELIARLLINDGDYVAFEEPGYPDARLLLQSHGARICQIRTDDGGMVVDDLLDSRLPIKLVYVTPSHQDPTGAVLTMERRSRLLDWAARTGAFIIEDDYDCEYRYGKKTLPSLQGMDRADCVIYMASMWKVLFQLLRFGIVVFPNRLNSIAVQAKMQMERHLPIAEQVALCDLINEGILERCIRRTQSRLARKRQSLIYAMTKHFRDQATLLDETAGMHLIANFKPELSEDRILRAAASAGVPIMSTKAYYSGSPKRSEFILPFGHIDEDRIHDCVLEWRQLLEDSDFA